MREMPDRSAGWRRHDPRRPSTAVGTAYGRGFLVATLIVFAALTLPVVVNGAPLLDDFSRCVDPQKPGYWHEQYQVRGTFRPATTVEIVAINDLCGTVPFSFAILIPWLLTLAVALLIRAFLKDIGVDTPWCDIGAGLWLLAPLGTESALWPSAFHVPLGLCLALISLRSFKRGRLALGTLFGVASCLSIEQAIFALPLAAWLVSPRDQRSRTLASTVALSLAVLGVYAVWHGTSTRYAVSMSERLADIFKDPEEYVIMPATGLGAQSVPAAVEWAYPISVLVLLLGAMAGWWVGPRLLRTQPSRRPLSVRAVLLALVMVTLINVPVALTYPHPDSPRLFTPTWLALSVFAAIAGSRTRRRWPSPVGAVAGLLIAASFLSLALSSWARIRSADAVENAMEEIAASDPDRAVVAVCGTTRTVVEPAPTGDFSIHEFLNFTEAAYEYYTGKTAQIRVGSVDAPGGCPDLAGTDAVFDFAKLVGR